jgi:hypothetical protein
MKKNPVLEEQRQRFSLLRRRILAPRVADKRRQRRERENQQAIERHVLKYATQS